MIEVICTAAAVGSILAYARRRPMIPYLGNAVCENCDHEWMVFHPNRDLEGRVIPCPLCGERAGVVW